jgi:hypothetical protein
MRGLDMYQKHTSPKCVDCISFGFELNNKKIFGMEFFKWPISHLLSSYHILMGIALTNSSHGSQI